MLEEVRETLGTIRRVAGHARRDLARDQQELALDRGRHPPRSPLNNDIQSADRLLQAPHHDEPGVQAVPVLRERDDLSHAAIMNPPSDTPGRFADLGPDQATRTEFTGASRSWTVNHELPASPEPNTSPDVAPKYIPIPAPSPSAANACRRIVR